MGEVPHRNGARQNKKGNFGEMFPFFVLSVRSFAMSHDFFTTVGTNAGSVGRVSLSQTRVHDRLHLRVEQRSLTRHPFVRLNLSDDLDL